MFNSYNDQERGEERYPSLSHRTSSDLNLTHGQQEASSNYYSFSGSIFTGSAAGGTELSMQQQNNTTTTTRMSDLSSSSTHGNLTSAPPVRSITFSDNMSNSSRSLESTDSMDSSLDEVLDDLLARRQRVAKIIVDLTRSGEKCDPSALKKFVVWYRDVNRLIRKHKLQMTRDKYERERRNSAPISYANSNRERRVSFNLKKGEQSAQKTRSHSVASILRKSSRRSSESI